MNALGQEALFPKKQASNMKRITDDYMKLDKCPVELVTGDFEKCKRFIPQFSQLYDNCVVPGNCEAIDIPGWVPISLTSYQSLRSVRMNFPKGIVTFLYRWNQVRYISFC